MTNNMTERKRTTAQEQPNTLKINVVLYHLMMFFKTGVYLALLAIQCHVMSLITTMIKHKILIRNYCNVSI